MEVALVFSTNRTGVSVFRLLDGQRRQISIYSPYGWTSGRVLAAALDELTDEEALQVAAALGLDRPDGAA